MDTFPPHILIFLKQNSGNGIPSSTDRNFKDFSVPIYKYQQNIKIQFMDKNNYVISIIIFFCY